MRPATVNWATLAEHECATAKITGRIDRRWLSLCNLYHARDVAIAMGNFAEARRLRALAIAGLC